VRLIFWLFSSASDNRDAYDIFAKGNFFAASDKLRVTKVLAGIKSALVSSPFVPKSGAFYLREIRGVILLFFEIFIKSSTFLESERFFKDYNVIANGEFIKFTIQLSVQ